MKWKDISKAPAIAKKNSRWLRLKGFNNEPYVCIGFWDHSIKDWHEIGTEGQVLVGVTHWAPLS